MSSEIYDKLENFSETEILARILPILPIGEDTVLGPGDDAAILNIVANKLVISSDMQVENIDFCSSWASGFDNGWKLVSQNVADIAAMGGVPSSLLINIGAPGYTPISWIEEVARGISAACSALNIPKCGVVGGDLSSASVKLLSATVLGYCEGTPIRRSSARPGSQIAISGTLGYAALGLAILKNSIEVTEINSCYTDIQLRPMPPIQSGVTALKFGAEAMIDISDGLLRDAYRIAKASKVNIVFHKKMLFPYLEALTEAHKYGIDPLDLVLNGGEEHSLLACFPENIVLPQNFIQIGTVTTLDSAGDSAKIFLENELQKISGFDHYSNSV